MNKENEVVYLPLDDIIPNRFQPRELFDEKALNELANSIKEHGVIQPIIVRAIGDKYEIIAGERRYKASALAGLIKIPAIVRNLDDKETAKVALLENLQRKDLSPIEEARTYNKILELDEMTQEELAKTMGKSQSAVANKLRLLSLPDEVQDALLKEKISERHARALLNVADTKKQVELLNRIIESRMTVRELEDEIQKINAPEVPVQPVSLAEPPVVDAHPKFFNFDEPTGSVEPVAPAPLPSALQTPDLDEIRANAKDINQERKVADLDSLLRLTKEDLPVEAPVEEPKPLSQMHFDDSDLTAKLESLLRPASVPVTEPVKEENGPSLVDDIPTTNSSNIETLDFDSPTPVIPLEKVSVPETVLNPPIEPYITNLRSAVNAVRDIIRTIEKSGLKVDSEEMDLVQEYQIVIKIAKEDE